MADKRVVCKKCGKEQYIKRADVRMERLPIDIPFTSSNRNYYYCKYCNAKNGLWPEEVPKC